MSDPIKFICTLVIQVDGEVDTSGDHIAVQTGAKCRIVPCMMWASGGPEGIEEGTDEAKLIGRIVAHNVAHRAVMELHLPGVTESTPMPIANTDPKERS